VAASHPTACATSFWGLRSKAQGPDRAPCDAQAAELEADRPAAAAQAAEQETDRPVADQVAEPELADVTACIGNRRPESEAEAGDAEGPPGAEEERSKTGKTRPSENALCRA
jgi:hypothetical protein